MKVLGVHYGHDSCASLIIDGKIIADAQEERFVRNKHSTDAPYNSIKYCLKAGNIKNINEVDLICIPWKTLPRQLSALFGVDQSFKSKGDLKIIRNKVVKKISNHFNINVPVYKRDLFINDTSKILCINHHICHASAAYFTSKNSKPCLIFSIDGSGDGICTGIYYAENNSIKKLKSYYKEGALGWPYSIVTEACGWIHGDGEGKLMGLAPYGDYNVCKGVLDDIFPVFEGTNLKKVSNFTIPGYWNENGSQQYQIQEAEYVQKLIEKYGKENIAAEAQRKLEENMISLVDGWLKKTKVERIAFTGGVSLNVKLNQKYGINLKKELTNIIAFLFREIQVWVLVQHFMVITIIKLSIMDY